MLKVSLSIEFPHHMELGKVIVCERFEKMPSGRTAVYICKISHIKDPQASMHRFLANKDKCKQWLKLIEEI